MGRDESSVFRFRPVAVASAGAGDRQRQGPSRVLKSGSRTATLAFAATLANSCSSQPERRRRGELKLEVNFGSWHASATASALQVGPRVQLEVGHVEPRRAPGVPVTVTVTTTRRAPPAGSLGLPLRQCQKPGSSGSFKLGAFCRGRPGRRWLPVPVRVSESAGQCFE